VDYEASDGSCCSASGTVERFLFLLLLAAAKWVTVERLIGCPDVIAPGRRVTSRVQDVLSTGFYRAASNSAV